MGVCDWVCGVFALGDEEGLLEDQGRLWQSVHASLSPSP